MPCRYLHGECACLQGLITYLSTRDRSGALQIITDRAVKWQVGQPGPYSLIYFAGGSCAQISLQRSGACNTSSAYLVDDNLAKQGADGVLVPLSQLDSHQSILEPEGVLAGSVCEPGLLCSDLRVVLGQASAYDFVLDSETQGICNLVTTLTVHSEESEGGNIGPSKGVGVATAFCEDDDSSIGPYTIYNLYRSKPTRFASANACTEPSKA